LIKIDLRFGSENFNLNTCFICKQKTKKKLSLKKFVKKKLIFRRKTQWIIFCLNKMSSEMEIHDKDATKKGKGVFISNCGMFGIVIFYIGSVLLVGECCFNGTIPR